MLPFFSLRSLFIAAWFCYCHITPLINLKRDLNLGAHISLSKLDSFSDSESELDSFPDSESELDSFSDSESELDSFSDSKSPLLELPEIIFGCKEFAALTICSFSKSQ
ncbi:hypothetical protein MANES_03G086922v8 [Manihot esculenta]|uniref:Uncharacterized protein n=1 Tax=Manihot esculenta TaxID=3983 RepID=A0ACB7HY45_MANES|nr:hypothetical protein MANES_03G086922v8 [Manihot esculenta]